MPIWISKTSADLPALLAAYATATSRSKVVLMNALSMPPLDALLVRPPEALRQQTAGDAAVDLARLGQL
eukprot:5574214-Prymnesium_polylepis.2